MIAWPVLEEGSCASPVRAFDAELIDGVEVLTELVDQSADLAEWVLVVEQVHPIANLRQVGGDR
jgi:hypothetical protein